MISYCFAFLCFPHPYTCMHVCMYLLFRISSVFIEFIRIIRIKKKNPLCE